MKIKFVYANLVTTVCQIIFYANYAIIHVTLAPIIIKKIVYLVIMIMIIGLWYKEIANVMNIILMMEKMNVRNVTLVVKDAMDLIQMIAWFVTVWAKITCNLLEICNFFYILNKLL